MTTGAAIALHRASYEVIFFWIDDVYITGLLTKHLGMEIVRLVPFLESYVLFDENIIDIVTRLPRRVDVVFGHSNNPRAPDANRKHLAMWNAVLAMNRRGQTHDVLPQVEASSTLL